MFNYCYRTYAGHLIWDLGLAHTSHLSLTEMSVPKQCALCVRRSFGAMPCWKLWKRNRRTPLGIFGKKCQGCCYWNASTKYRSCMPQTGIKKIRKVSAFLQGFWFKARPKNLTVPDRNQSWFSLGAWLRFQCLNSSDDDDVPCSQAGNIQISRKFSVSDYSDLLAEASPTTRPRAQQSASARSDLDFGWLFWQFSPNHQVPHTRWAM